MQDRRQMREQIAQQPPVRRASAKPTIQPRRSAPRATALPHGAGFHDGFHPEDRSYTSTELKGGQPTYEDEDEVDASYYETRLPTSTRRYRSTDEQEIVRGNKRLVIHREAPPQYRRRRLRFHWLFFLGLGMFIMISGWWIFTSIGTWWINQQNTWTYGMPRTFQTDAVVGHNDSSVHPTHFIALNLNGHIEVIEIPGGDPTHERVYIGPTIFGSNPALTPVTLSFQDVNGDGKVDMLVHVGNQTIVFLNDGKGQFQSPK
ncbi:MAG TPA: VCBS repeat-containing protein [Ktedonobacteraceae bacterium]|nr:VCBS repeat-containing protein [Ktedonobacteraceae bacterium]